MSRAFVREDGPDNDPLPDLPLSPHPNYVTPRGLKALQDRLAETQATLASLKARKDRLDRNPEKAAERDIRYFDARLKSAIPVPPPENPAEAAFATAVTVADEDGQETTYEIVGEDEADATRHRIAPQSPLARALIGAAPGDTVTWRRPSGVTELEILAVEPLPC